VQIRNDPNLNAPRILPNWSLMLILSEEGFFFNGNFISIPSQQSKHEGCLSFMKLATANK
jgi:hypothetical protein